MKMASLGGVQFRLPATNAAEKTSQKKLCFWPSEKAWRRCFCSLSALIMGWQKVCLKCRLCSRTGQVNGKGECSPSPSAAFLLFFLLCRSLNLQSVENVMGNQPTENAIIHIILSSFILSAIVMIRQAAWQC